MTALPTLWIPGPTQVRPELLQACATPAIGHRTPTIVELTERIDPHLRHAFGLKKDSDAHVCVHTCSGTALMEMALLGAGQRILSVVNGAFSDRWSKVGGLVGRDVTRLEVEWGDAVTPARLRETLEQEGPFDAVTLVVNETSTGVRTPIEPVAEVLRDFPDTRLLCDVVSYIAGAPIAFDANGLDFALAGVQKALALPPGLAVFCASDRYLEEAKTRDRRGFYLDPVRIVEGHEKRKTPATPSTQLYWALAQQLEDISSGATLPPELREPLGPNPEPCDAWVARFEKHLIMQRRTIEWAAEHGTRPLPSAENASPLVSCLLAGDIDAGALVAGMKERGVLISNGYGDLKGKTFRIGHMGDHLPSDLEKLLAQMDEVLAS